MLGPMDCRMGNWKAMKILEDWSASSCFSFRPPGRRRRAMRLFQAQTSRELMDETKNRFIFVFNDLVPRGSVPEWADALVREHGGQVIHHYSAALKGFAARMAPEAAARLAAKPFIAYYEPDQLAWAVARPRGKGNPLIPLPSASARRWTGGSSMLAGRETEPGSWRRVGNRYRRRSGPP